MMFDDLEQLQNLRTVDVLKSAPFLMRRVVRDPAGDLMIIESLSAELAQTLELKLYFQDAAREFAQHKIDGVVEILEMGSSQELGFYVLYPFLNNITLDKVLDAQNAKNFALPAEYSASIILETASILERLHEKDFFHLGLRPDHIGIDEHGNLSVTGFLEAALRKRFGFKTWGCEKLDPPELRQGKALNFASDIYALAAILYRLFTAKEQADEWEPQWMGMMLELDRALIPGDALTSTIDFFQRALAERPQQRYASMQKCVEALQKLMLNIGNRKSPELIAEALAPLRTIAIQPTIQADLEERSAVFDRGEQLYHVPNTKVLSPELAEENPIILASPSKETRVITRANSGNFRAISSELRNSLQNSALNVLARSRYQIMEELGTGGTGTVYKVLDTTLAEILALKILRPELVNDSAWLHRFKRELKVTRDLDHEYILPAYHLEHIDGVYFFTMRYIDGQNLYQKLKSGPVPYAECTHILRCAALALREAHSQGVIHRDFKTANIMIESASGHPYLMDFGIALSRENPGLTVAGQGIGTPYYMAPEQSRGEQINEQADIYSFGVVCYECFARRLPFDGPTTVAIYTAQISGVFEHLREIEPCIPKALDELVDRCLQADAAKRPKSMQEVLDILDSLPKSLKGEYI
ncbi:MAG: serine/threonine-protein kinase [Bradymonadales bacterium]